VRPWTVRSGIRYRIQPGPLRVWFPRWASRWRHLAGTPVTMDSGGASLTTTALAPTALSRPMVIGPRILAPAPMVTRSPMGGMAFDPCEGPSTEGDAVVDHHVLADLRGLTNHHTHAVVDEEPAADRGTGMYFDAGPGPPQLGEQPCRKPQARCLPQPVGQPMDPDGVQTGIGEKVLKRTSSRRVVDRAASRSSFSLAKKPTKFFLQETGGGWF
jgi:hypothetical protein